jgi:hypothetical protein
MKLTKFTKYILLLIPISVVGFLATKKQSGNAELALDQSGVLGYDIVDTAYADVPAGYDGGAPGSSCSGGGGCGSSS